MSLEQQSAEDIAKLRANIELAVLGKPEVVKLVVTALLAGEHILLEDVPGVGKTLIAKALAKSLNGRFSRLQFTPDLLPSDITGSSVYNSSNGQFSFNPGPIFANVVLADEVNRSAAYEPALLEAMGESQVSVDGETHKLPSPLLVMATQNPFEYEGTYLLPESQLDRFLLRISVGYPQREHERNLLKSHRVGEPVDELQPVLSTERVLALQHAARQVRIEESLVEYLLDIVHATRDSEALQVGVSMCGALAFYHASQALALVENRDHVIPDDIKRLAIPVLAHRVVSHGMLPGAERSASEDVIRRLLSTIAIPT